MPNAIKYNTSSESLALKKNNFWIGTGDVGKGPTSSTGYYNGINPPSGGYTVYLNKASGGPSIYTCANNSELISLTNSIAGTSYTSATQCFVYYSGQSDKMVVNSDYGNYVTSGMVMHVDAGYLPSFPQSGTSFFNITYSANTAFVGNGTNWSDYGVGGAFLYDGVDDYILLHYDSQRGLDYSFYQEPFTFCVWARKTQTNPQTSLLNRSAYGAGGGWYFGFNNGSQIRLGTQKDGTNITEQYSTTNLISNNTWYYVAGTFDNVNSSKIYCNGIDVTGNPVTMNVPGFPPYPLCYNLGMYNCISGGYKEFYKGYIAMHSAYNRVLSASEILQNYNATKSRFGL